MLGRQRLDLSGPGRAIFGRGSAAEVGELVRELGAARAFVVTDPGVAASGVVDVVQDSLRGSGLVVGTFDAVAPNPAIGDVEAGSEALRSFGTEGSVVVAVGGGSAMDAAKGIALHAANGGAVAGLDYRNEPARPGVALVAVPTTAGTGSETNGFGVITDPASGRKFYVGHASVRPAVAVLDPEATLGLPPGATAATGLDALVHALEALMSRSANPYADGLALQVVRMVRAWLPIAFGNGADIEARSQMLLAAHLAGRAFSSGTGLGLCHAIAHPIGARLGAPHGVALAAVLPSVMSFNLPTSAEKLALAAQSLGVADPANSPEANAREAISATQRLIEEVLGEPTLAGLGVTRESVPALTLDALEDGVISNTPRTPSREEVETLLISAL